jgi:hypothetical protein
MKVKVRVQSNDLWEVKWKAETTDRPDDLLVLAASASIAETKAKKFTMRKGHTKVRIMGVQHVGEIDVF